MIIINIEGTDKEHTPVALGKAAQVHSIVQEDCPIFDRKALKTSYLKNYNITRVDNELFTVSNRLVKFSEMEESFQIIETVNIYCASFIIPYEYRSKDFLGKSPTHTPKQKLGYSGKKST